MILEAKVKTHIAKLSKLIKSGLSSTVGSRVRRLAFRLLHDG